MTGGLSTAFWVTAKTSLIWCININILSTWKFSPYRDIRDGCVACSVQADGPNDLGPKASSMIFIFKPVPDDLHCDRKSLHLPRTARCTPFREQLPLDQLRAVSCFFRPFVVQLVQSRANPGDGYDTDGTVDDIVEVDRCGKRRKSCCRTRWILAEPSEKNRQLRTQEVQVTPGLGRWCH